MVIEREGSNMIRSSRPPTTVKTDNVTTLHSKLPHQASSKVSRGSFVITFIINRILFNVNVHFVNVGWFFLFLQPTFDWRERKRVNYFSVQRRMFFIISFFLLNDVRGRFAREEKLRCFIIFLQKKLLNLRTYEWFVGLCVKIADFTFWFSFHFVIKLRRMSGSQSLTTPINGWT